MSKEVYKQLLEVMKSRWTRFEGADIPEFFELVEEMFTPEEAEVNNAMPPASEGLFTVKDLAKRMGRDEAEMKVTLERMSKKGLVRSHMTDSGRLYEALPMLPGVMEFTILAEKDKERAVKLARLEQAYKKAFLAINPLGHRKVPAVRIIPVESAIDSGSKVHTYNQVFDLIEKSEYIALKPCFCRLYVELLGEDLHGMPVDVCFSFGRFAQYPIEALGFERISKEKAKEVLDQAEEAGLVHVVHNCQDAPSYLCNCDRWHCFALQSYLSQPKPGLEISSGYEPRIDPELCIACGNCIDRCPPVALAMNKDDVPEVNMDRCIGCGLCASGCPEKAIAIFEKPGYEMPPKDINELLGRLKNS